MIRSLEALKQTADVIKVDARAQSQRTSSDAERRLARRRTTRIESGANRIIHDGLEGSSRSARHSTQLVCDVVLEGECRSLGHVMKPIMDAS